MEAEAAKLIGAGIAVLPLLGVGIGIGNIFSALVNSIARNPSARDDVFGVGILGFALTEAIALFALVVALLLLFVF
ncbi:MAG: F0F1 ATP synthase subunit C [Proteobacteria bacterium]|nr:F0F1 ATP synthase subunit C [Pseudomonadota bacterium]